MKHIKKFESESKSIEITIEEFQDIVDALRDAKDLAEDVSNGVIDNEEKAGVVLELVDNALSIMKRLGS